jgi:D-alanyl-D-alanine dipeptidase
MPARATAASATASHRRSSAPAANAPRQAPRASQPVRGISADDDEVANLLEGLLAEDAPGAYRPWYITKVFWNATPEAQHDFVADPAQGSRHNRGCAVDLTLFDRRTGQPVVMPSLYDEFSPRASADYQGGTADARGRRDRLRRAMEAEGFAVYEAEWWHFDYRDWRSYAIENRRFEDVGRGAPVADR